MSWEAINTQTRQRRTKKPMRALTGAGSTWATELIHMKTSERDTDKRNIAMKMAGIKKDRTGPRTSVTNANSMIERGVDRLRGVKNTGEGTKGRCNRTKYMTKASRRILYELSVGPGVDGSAKRNESNVRYDWAARVQGFFAMSEAAYTIKMIVRHSGGGDGLKIFR